MLAKCCSQKCALFTVIRLFSALILLEIFYCTTNLLFLDFKCTTIKIMLIF